MIGQRGAAMRLFFAIELPKDVRGQLLRLRGELERKQYGRVKWERPENLHLTLKFLGDVPDPAVPALCEAVRAARGSGPFRLRPEGWVFFPERGPVRIVAAGVGGDTDWLTLLQRDVESACEAAGYPRDARAYHAHLTIGRAKDGLPHDLRTRYGHRPGGRTPPGAGESGPAFDVTEFVLMESQLRPEGPLYTPVARFALDRPASEH